MKNKSVAWAKKINTMVVQFMEGCLPITTNAMLDAVWKYN